MFDIFLIALAAVALVAIVFVVIYISAKRHSAPTVRGKPFNIPPTPRRAPPPPSTRSVSDPVLRRPSPREDIVAGPTSETTTFVPLSFTISEANGVSLSDSGFSGGGGDFGGGGSSGSWGDSGSSGGDSGGGDGGGGGGD